MGGSDTALKRWQPSAWKPAAGSPDHRVVPGDGPAAAAPSGGPVRRRHSRRNLDTAPGGRGRNRRSRGSCVRRRPTPSFAHRGVANRLDNAPRYVRLRWAPRASSLVEELAPPAAALAGLAALECTPARGVAGQSSAHDVKRLALGKRLRAWLTSAGSNSAARRLTTILLAMPLGQCP
jgi:hypothetical protein